MIVGEAEVGAARIGDGYPYLVLAVGSSRVGTRRAAARTRAGRVVPLHAAVAAMAATPDAPIPVHRTAPDPSHVPETPPNPGDHRPLPPTPRELGWVWSLALVLAVWAWGLSIL